MDLLASVSDDADDDLCEEGFSKRGGREGRRERTLPAVFAPGLGLVASTEVRDVLRYSVHSAAEEHLVLVVERNDDKQLRLPVVERRTQCEAVGVEFLGLKEWIS